MKVAAKTLDNEKFPLDVPPVAGGAARRRSCQSSIARCFILLSPESQSQLISAPCPTVPDPNLPPPSPCRPRRHGNKDQPCGAHIYTHSHTHTHRPIAMHSHSFEVTFENILKCDVAVGRTVRDGCTNHGLGLRCLLYSPPTSHSLSEKQWSNP